MKNFKTANIIFISLIAALIIIGFSSCGRLDVDEVSMAYIPPVLTGGAGFEGSRALEAETAPTYVSDFPEAQWDQDYPNWTVVPKVSTYFNNIFVQTLSNFTDGFRDVESIDAGGFTKEGTFEGEDVVRINDTGSAWERSFDLDGGKFRGYLRYEETDVFRRAMRIWYNIGGRDNSEILEMYETTDYKFVKVLWWSNVSAESDSPPKLNHFVSVVDKTSSDDKTTGRMISENFSANDFTTHIFSFTPHTAADTDYFTYESGSPGFGDSSNDAYGYFNKNDFYVETTGIAAPASSSEFSDYIDPDKLTALFGEGFTESMWVTLRTKVNSGESIDFIDWDISQF